MAASKRRPSIITKLTQMRAEKRLNTIRPGDFVPSPLVKSVVVGLGYAGLATYLCTRFHKFSAWELVSISLGSLSVGYGLFDIGKRTGLVQGSMRGSDKNTEDGERRDWRGEFTGMEYEQLNTREKITWLKKEEARIREMQEEEQLKCGQAYIAKEDAYVAYEKHGGYGGSDWKRYSSADGVCQDMYRQYEKQQKRLRQIRAEINVLSGDA